MSESTSAAEERAIAYAQHLFDLARDGDAAALRTALAAGVPVNLTNANGDTLLILAAYHRHADVVRVLLDHGADVHRHNDRGQNALVSAVFQQDAPVVRMLLDAGADPAVGTPSAVDTARAFGLPAMAELLEEHRPAT